MADETTNAETALGQLFLAEIPAPVVVLSATDHRIIYKNKFCGSPDRFIYKEHQISIEVLARELIDLNKNIKHEVRQGDKIYSFQVTSIGDQHFIYGTDITQLINERDFYNEVLDNLPADIGIFNPSLQYLFVNPQGIKDPQLREWIIGKTDFDYCKYRGRPTLMAEQRKEILDKVLESKKEYGYEEAIKNPDGSKRYQLRRLFPVLDENGSVKFIIGYGLNITDRKIAEERTVLSEKRFRQIFDYSLALICIHDLNGIITDVNPALCHSLEYTAEEVLTKSIKDFIDPETKDFFENAYLEPLKTKGEAKGIFIIITKAGEKKYLLYHNYLVAEEDGEPFIIGFSQDITEIKRAEWAQKKSNKLIEATAKAKEDFLASISHEIRTPMNAIIGMSRQLEKTKLEQDQHQYLDAIISASSNLLVLINDILDFSKIEAGKLRLESIGFSFNKVVENVKFIISQKAEEKGLDLHFNIDEHIAPILKGDPYRISQVLINLLGNAVKFTDAGNVTTSLRLLKDENKIQEIEISIADTGIGMSEDFMQNLFQMFSQEDDSITRKYGGTGLGMGITQQLVEMMAGTISVKSKKKEGTSFTIILSFPKGNKYDLPGKKRSVINKESLKGKVILLADDNELNRFVGITTLKGYGAHVILSVDGRDTIEKLLQNPDIEIILMDIHMPGMTGIEATAQIRAQISASLPIIAMSATVSSEEERNCLSAGMNGFIAKPFQEEDLVNTILHWTNDDPTIVAESEEPYRHKTHHGLFNLRQVEELSQGDKAFEREVMEIFIRDVSAMVIKLNKAASEKDFETIRLTAHKVKSSAKLLEINPIIENLEILEKIKEENTADIGLIYHVTNTLDSICGQLQQMLNKGL